MTRIFVTGATGFIGKHLVAALLNRDDDVRCLVRPASSTQRPEGAVECVDGDLTDYDSLCRGVAGCDLVYHLGGLIDGADEESLMRVNAGGTANLARACAEQPRPPVLIVVSSLAAAGPARPGRPRTEVDPPEPISAYGRSKRAAEVAAAQWSHVVPTSIVRPGIVFGPSDREMLPVYRCIRYLRFHALPHWRTPRLSLIEVHDLVDLLILVAERGRRLEMPSSSREGAGPGYYFAATDEHPTYAELGRLIGETAGRPYMLPVALIPPVPWIAATVNEWFCHLFGKRTSFTRDKIREALAPSWECSNVAAREQLAWRPMASLREQLAATFRWYREHGWL